MARRWTLLLGALAMAAGAQPASAQEGSGLYEPFPGPVTEERAVAFVRTMIAAAGGDSRRAAVDAARLRAGIVLARGFPPASPGPVSARAKPRDDFGGSIGVALSLALILMLCVALAPRLRPRT
jgi:hypothetical protein